MKKKKTPAPEADFTDAFFREVSEDVHNDNIKAFWKKYGVQIIAVVVICLTAAVSFESIKHWRDLRSQRWTDAFVQAQQLADGGKYDESVKVLTYLAQNAGNIYADEARLEIINILLKQKKEDEALAQLEDFTQTTRYKQLRNAALVKLALYKVDTAKTDEIVALLEPVLREQGGAWLPHAQEIMALSFLQQGDTNRAESLYNEILKYYEQTGSNSRLRDRAKNMVSVLAYEGENQK